MYGVFLSGENGISYACSSIFLVRVYLGLTKAAACSLSFIERMSIWELEEVVISGARIRFRSLSAFALVGLILVAVGVFSGMVCPVSSQAHVARRAGSV